ncbi:UNVERIFIED_CONTAM: hypothetical protein RMT77_001328 [Armadillidium vulgare]
MYPTSLSRPVQCLMRRRNFTTLRYCINQNCLKISKFLNVYSSNLYSKRFSSITGSANENNKFLINSIINKFSSNYYDVLEKSKVFHVEALNSLQESVKQMNLYENEIKELKFVQNDEPDSKIKELMKEEIQELGVKVSDLKEEFFSQLMENFTYQGIEEFYLEISAGVGGQEAMLFVKDLMTMYEGYCLRNGFNFEIVSFEDTPLGGVRKVCMLVKGNNSYMNLKYEGGIHRVQRVPKTEKGGRIHTSTASVVILPVPSEVNIQMSEKDLKIEFTRASGPGGQNVNKSNSAVRITHLPTGIVVDCQIGRSQEGNKKEALRKLRAKLYELETDKQISNVTFQRKLQTGTRARSEKIRTYNFVQDRVTDHRVGISIHNIEDIMAGGSSLGNLTTELMRIGKLEKIREILSIRDE